MKKTILSVLGISVLMVGCHNGDVDFPDYEYQTIYFAKQTPIRTVTLGDDGDFDTSLDNQHIIEIKAALGGVNENRKEHSAAFVVDNTLCDRIQFSDGREIKPMPANYYTISGDRMVIHKGAVIGGVQVHLSDAYFADPLSVDVNYVIPLLLTSSNDSILSGAPKDGVVNPDRLNVNDWSILPKDYILYAVKYKNPYHGVWLSKGVDVLEHRGETKTDDRIVEFWEKASLRELSTISLTRSRYSFNYAVPTIAADGSNSEKNIAIDLYLDIDDNGNCKITTETPGCTASGSGKWTHKGEPKAWGDKDRDLIELDYTFNIEYVYNDATGEKANYKMTTKENLVMRDRQNKLEEFSFVMK